jgi:phosphoribosylaminoimidazole (AIR) synthetase
MTDHAIFNLTVEDGIRAAYTKQMAQDFTLAAKQGADPRAFEQWYATAHPLSQFANQVGPQIAQQAQQTWKGGVAAAAGITPQAPTAPPGWKITKAS